MLDNWWLATKQTYFGRNNSVGGRKANRFKYICKCFDKSFVVVIRSCCSQRLVTMEKNSTLVLLSLELLLKTISSLPLLSAVVSDKPRTGIHGFIRFAATVFSNWTVLALTFSFHFGYYLSFVLMHRFDTDIYFLFIYTNTI